jgi:glycosyltransferase involved in cell wall biosynthesis
MVEHLKYLKEYYFIKRSGLFDFDYYDQKNPDVSKANINPLLHFILFGWKEFRNPSPLFDTKFYMSQNPDVVKAGINPLLHFLKIGGAEHRNPSKLFNSSWYINVYEDVKEAGYNPLVHYEKHGKYENRFPLPNIDLESVGLPMEVLFPSTNKTQHSKPFLTNLMQTTGETQKKLILTGNGSHENQNKATIPCKPDVTVVIPVYNKSRHLSSCLESILNQKSVSLEVICVDDCSTDGSYEIAKKIAQNDSRLKLFINDTNKGASYSRNRGIALASGSYVQFTDADDLLPKGSLAALFEAAERTESEVSRGSLLVLGYNIGAGNLIAKEKVGKLDDLKELWIFFWHTSYLISRDLLIRNNVKYPDLILGEDPVFIALVLSKAAKICIISQATYIIRVNYYRPQKDFRMLNDYIKHMQLIKNICIDSLEACWLTYRDFIINNFLDHMSIANVTYQEKQILLERLQNIHSGVQEIISKKL